MRYPAVAGRFYPADEKSLIREIGDCFNHPLGPGLPGEVGDSRDIIGAVVPHAGYRASGMNAAHVYRRMREDGRPDAYVVIGPDHHGVPYRSVMCSESYLTPLGECAIHKGIADRLKKLIPDDPDAHFYEHSVEVQVPFIQYIDDDPRIIPVIMRDQSPGHAAELAEAVREACDGYDVIVIASSDLSHYVAKEKASADDGMVMRKVSEMDVQGLYDVIGSRRMSVCGYGPIAVAMIATGASSVELLKYSDSEDSLGKSGSGVVGYGSAVLMKGHKPL